MCFNWSSFEAEFKSKLQETVGKLDESYKRIYAARIHPDLFGNIKVPAYGSENALKELSNIQLLSARSVAIRPYDPSLLEEIQKALRSHFQELSPTINVDHIRITLNSPTEESRKKTVKEAKEYLENSRVHVRNLRKDYMGKLKKSELPEDQEKKYINMMEDQVKEINTRLNDVFLEKEKELMTI